KNKNSLILQIVVGTLLFAIPLLIPACSGLNTEQIEGAGVKVAKVDTDYVYEANIDKYIDDYRQAGRTRFSNFVGFTPDMILIARETAIDNEIRREIKRLPGVEISPRDVRELAARQVEELAHELYARITTGGEDFAEIARQYSTGEYARLGGKLPLFGVNETPEPYQEKAYEMQVGEISEPFSNYEGWRIIRLESVTDDPYEGPQYQISVIFLTADLARAEATIVDENAQGHAIEILDPKYNSRQALIGGNFDKALEMADEAVARRDEDDLAHYLRARALWGLNRHDEAFLELEKASEVGKISDALIPYYHYYRGQYYEELGDTENALTAYHACFDSWRQDINLAYLLLDTFRTIGDEEYLATIKNEIDIIQAQDATVIWLHASGSQSGVIATGEGTVEGSAAEYEEGYRGE
ncbi:MAG: peptidylprolyl isomerase, partial [bacterium]|nr:peptidylprolyl isomerase [bacterium]